MKKLIRVTDIIRVSIAIIVDILFFVFFGWISGLVFAFLTLYTEAETFRHRKIDNQIELITMALEALSARVYK